METVVPEVQQEYLNLTNETDKAIESFCRALEEFVKPFETIIKK